MSLSRMSVVVLFLVAAVATVHAATVTRVEEVVVVTAVGRVNINTADVKELMTLKGVGQKVAEKIIEHRTAKGPFKTPDQLRDVPGIGTALFEKNRDRIVVK